jgi:hypothetical protein
VQKGRFKVASIPNVDVIKSTLEKNAPDVYTNCIFALPDNKGNLKEKRYTLSLKTGDVFKNRRLLPVEQMNFCLTRRYYDHDKSVYGISHCAYQNAQAIDGNIVLATWVLADYINYPDTTEVHWAWGTNGLISDEKRGTTVSPDAILNISLSKPKVAAMVVVTPEKEIFSWEDKKNYGLMAPRYHNSENMYLAPSLLNVLSHAYDAKRVVGLTECFKKVFQIGYIGANKYVSFDSYKDIALFMKTSPMAKKSGKMQNRVDELANIQLPDHTTASMFEDIICYADRVNDEWTVLRWYHQLGSSNYAETARMYVNKTEAIHCRSDLKGHWVYAAAKIKAETFKADKIVLQTPDVFDGTKLEYFKTVSPKLSNRSAALYMLTMYPEFEKMCKAGMIWLCDNYLKSPYQQSWKSYLECHVGRVDLSEKNILKMIGINRHQADVLEKFRKKMVKYAPEGSWQARCADRMIKRMKDVFGVDSLSSIDNETFDYILNSFNGDRLTSGYANALHDTFAMYHQDALYFIKDLNTVANGGNQRVSIRNEYGHVSTMNVDRLYHDTIRMIRLGQYTDVIRPRFASVEELVNHHQVMVDLINADKNAHEARVNAKYNEAFTTYSKRWKKWEYDEDETFCVIAPTAPVDIAVEGITLRHCVKSYIPSIATGSTNIVFIRRKDHISDPFFTVEVDTHNNIRQVHGMCNCNVSTVEGLADFVKEWAKIKKLKYSQGFANGIRAAG